MKYSELTEAQRDHFDRMIEKHGEVPQDCTHVDTTRQESIGKGSFLVIDQEGNESYWSQRYKRWRRATDSIRSSQRYPVPDKPWTLDTELDPFDEDGYLRLGTYEILDNNPWVGLSVGDKVTCKHCLIDGRPYNMINGEVYWFDKEAVEQGWVKFVKPLDEVVDEDCSEESDEVGDTTPEPFTHKGGIDTSSGKVTDTQPSTEELFWNLLTKNPTLANIPVTEVSIPLEREKSVSSHYDKHMYRVLVSQEDADRGFKEFKLDPYVVCDFYSVGGGPLEHLVKKGLRGVGKGHSKLELWKELQKCVERGLEMELERLDGGGM